MTYTHTYRRATARSSCPSEAQAMRGPKPAWTAVGTTSLLPDAGIVDVQMIAHARLKPRKG